MLAYRSLAGNIHAPIEPSHLADLLAFEMDVAGIGVAVNQRTGVDVEFSRGTRRGSLYTALAIGIALVWQAGL